MTKAPRRQIPPHDKTRKAVGANLVRLMGKSSNLKTSRQVEAKSREVAGPLVGIERRQFERILKGEIGTSVDTLGFLAELFDVEVHELLIVRRELLQGNMTDYERNAPYSPDSTMQSTARKDKKKTRR